MRTAPQQLGAPATAHDPVQELMAFLEQTLEMVSVARALVSHQRHLDLNGLQQQVGLLCAKALDLPPGSGGLVRVELQRLLRELDALQDAMRQNAA